MQSPFNLKHWIDAHREQLRPPVGNRRLFRDAQFIVMAVGGPNSRKDFHVDPGEEFFYQLEGDLLLRTVQQGRIDELWIREGDVFVLPAGIPHSPQRFPDTVGLVVERERRRGEIDALEWYCERCESLLHREAFELTDIEAQFPPIFARFFGDRALRTCRQCGAVMEPPG
jgi:3-hydroxyanthranilate 3,4-dioxygenase